MRHELISPLLRCIAHCMSSAVAPDGWDGGEALAYSSTLNVESHTERRPHVRGAKPRVD